MCNCQKYLIFNQRQINKTTLLLRDKDKEKQNNFIAPTFTQSVAWVIDTVDYSALDQRQIDQQYNKLRRQLQNINIQLAKAIQKIDLKVVKKHKTSQQDPTRTLQIRDKQVQNNNAIIDRLRKQYLQLQKRISNVSVGTKDQIEQQIQKTKQQLDKMKKKIKQLKLKNKAIGDTIVNSEDLYDQIRRLQNEKQVNQRKKFKLQAKTDQVYDQISNSQLRLEEISDDFQVAQNYFEQYWNKNHVSEQQKQMQSKMRHAKHCLEIVTRKNQTSTNLKQQKYHVSLKNLQTQMGKLNIVQQKTASIELEIIHCKKLIAQYEQIYRQNQQQRGALINQQPLFFTQFQQNNGKQTNQIKQQKKYTSEKVTHDKQRKKTQTQKVTEIRQNYKSLQQKQFIAKQQQQQKTNSRTKERQNLITSNGLDQQQEQDIIVQLDQKFKYKTKSQMRSSRYNQKQTQMGEDVPEDLIGDDDQLQDFKTKISQQKNKRKSKQGFDILKDLSKVKNHLESIDLTKKKQQQNLNLQFSEKQI